MDATAAAAQASGVAFQVEDAGVARLAGLGMDIEAASGHDHHILAVASVFITDARGTIQFNYVNPDYRVRIPGDLRVAAARSVSGIGPYDLRPTGSTA